MLKTDEGKERFPKEDSIWANKHKISEDSTREQVIELYEKEILEKNQKGEITKEQLQFLKPFGLAAELFLKGKKLGCWCKPEACHGDVLIKLINEYC